MKKFFGLVFLLVSSGMVMSQQQTKILGTVTINNAPVWGATVLVAHTQMGAVTDSLGRFSLAGVPAGPQQLLVSYVGLQRVSKEVVLQPGQVFEIAIELAQQEHSLNEIVVTGVSKATRVRENPVAITTVSARQMEQTGAGNVIDVLVKNVPGLNAVKTGANVSKPFIRGLGYNRVLTLYDGMRQEGQQWGDEHSIEVDAYHINRAEVIKGPASLLYGSDALAGVISFFPYVPTNDDDKIHGKLVTEYQTNNNLIGTGLRLHYRNNGFLFALRGSHRLAKNYRNAVDGRVYLTSFNESNLSALAGYEWNKGYTHLNFTWYNNHQAIPDGSRDSVTRRFTKQVFEGEDDIIKMRPVVRAKELNSYKIPDLAQRIQHYRFYLHGFYNVGRGDVDVLLGLQRNDRQEFNHPTMPKQAGMHVRLNTLNYGIRYNAPGFWNIEATIGLNGMLQNNTSINATDFPIPDYNLYDGGLYVYGKWKRNCWSVSGGLRYDLRQVQWDDFYVAHNSETGFQKHVNTGNAAGAELQFAAYKKLFHGTSASLGGTFQASKQISVKANIGRGYRSPNITEMASNGLDPGAHIIYLGNRNFEPEFSFQQDFGVSARLKNWSADVSFFNNNISNYIYLSLVADENGNPVVDAQGNKTYQYQQAAAQLYGAEAWWVLHPATLNGFRFDNSLAVVYGHNKNAAFKKKGHNGEYLPLLPPLKLVSSVAQTIHAGKKSAVTLTPKFEAEYTAAQNRYFGYNNTETPTPSYTLFNASVVAEIALRHASTLQLQLQANNLFNKAYQSNLSRLKYFEYFEHSPNGRFGIYNMGRNLILKAVISF